MKRKLNNTLHGLLLSTPCMPHHHQGNNSFTAAIVFSLILWHIIFKTAILFKIPLFLLSFIHFTRLVSQDYVHQLISCLVIPLTSISHVLLSPSFMSLTHTHTYTNIAAELGLSVNSCLHLSSRLERVNHHHHPSFLHNELSCLGTSF